MRPTRFFILGLILTLLAPTLQASAWLPPAATEPGFVAPSFGTLWARTDRPVADGAVARSWVWGPGPGPARTEPYKEAPGGLRTVQYFDKARMEVNPAAAPGGPWEVTTGLLVVEMVGGRMQTGDHDSLRRAPAEIPVAGDADPPGAGDPLSPVYRSFATLASLSGGPDRKAADRRGTAVTETINRAGTISPGPQADVRYASYVPETGHNIPDVFWNYLHTTGPVQDGGKLTQAALFDWVYVLGYPITEAYWAVVRVDGKPQRVLIQLYQRRVLTYTPANGPDWQVQMGNAGAHYYRWRYGADLPTTGPAGNAPLPTPQPAGAGFVSLAGDQFIYNGSSVTLKGTNWWKHDSPFADSWALWDGAQTVMELGKAKELGVNTVRVGVPYDTGATKVLWDCKAFDDPECGHEWVSAWMINEMQQLLQIAAANDMKVIFSLFDWSDSFPAPGDKAYRIQNTYVQGIVTPFANDDRVLAWELHNEPDNYQTWKEGGSAKVIAWAQQTALLIRALDRNHPITVGVGNYASLWTPGPGGVTLLDLSDFVSFHSYDAGTLGAQIATIRAHTTQPIFLGELGWPSGPSKYSTADAHYDQATQNYLYTEMLRVAKEQKIGGVAQYTLFDFPNGITTGFKRDSIEENFGLFDFGGTAKPAAAIFRDQYSGRPLPSVLQTRYPLTRDKQRPTGEQFPP